MQLQLLDLVIGKENAVVPMDQYGEAISEPDPRGGKIVDAKFLLLFNSDSEPIMFTLPEASQAAGWEVVIDTSTGQADGEEDGAILLPKSEVEVGARAVVVLRSED